MVESRRYDLVRAAGGWRGSGEASSPVSAIEGREAAGTEATSAWNGEKRPKIQTTPTPSRDLGNVARDGAGRSSGEIVHGQDQEQEQEQDQIEGLDWDGEKLSKEVAGLRQWMEDPSQDDDYASAHDDELWVHFNKEQQTALNQRLALCRIRAHEKQYRGLDDASLLAIFPPSVLEDNCYYDHYECDFDWFFDPAYCKLAHVEDYQRMVLRVTMNFTDALRYLYNEGKYRSIFLWGMGTELEPNLFSMEQLYKPHLDRIVEKAQDGDVLQLVMDTIVENFWKPRTYYEYVRKKMRIAEEIGLIRKQPPHRLYVPGCYLR